MLLRLIPDKLQNTKDKEEIFKNQQLDKKSRLPAKE